MGPTIRIGRRRVSQGLNPSYGHYCGSIFASLITVLHSAASSAKNFAVSGREVAPGSSERSRSLSLTSVLESAASASRLIRSAIAVGVPGGATRPNQARLREGRDLGQRRHAPKVGDREDLEHSGAVERRRGGRRVEEHVDPCGHQVGERRLRAPIGHVHHADAGERLELACRQMRGRADPLGRIGELARVRSAIGDERGE